MTKSDTDLTVLIVGCGPAGLINARTLIQDGFKVTIVAKEEDVGGCWRYSYPDLTTNSPWGAFTFSGLDMAKPSNHKGDVVPARTYRRYLEDFYHHFVKDKAEVLFNTEIISLLPQEENKRGWIAQLRAKKREMKRKGCLIKSYWLQGTLANHSFQIYSKTHEYQPITPLL
ncbi:hypothetical protein V865_007817 [Kwoniella europaea PYCC6329]|uniref:FAD/NAD(P)-binding domain-containing protein n=1 Tax=Kwoniella europaea PYCC6329 TaxID=1423913 RepID=A0AAX4KUE3_9TREE